MNFYHLPGTEKYLFGTDKEVVRLLRGNFSMKQSIQEYMQMTAERLKIYLGKGINYTNVREFLNELEKNKLIVKIDKEIN